MCDIFNSTPFFNGHCWGVNGAICLALNRLVSRSATLVYKTASYFCLLSFVLFFVTHVSNSLLFSCHPLFLSFLFFSFYSSSFCFPSLRLFYFYSCSYPPCPRPLILIVNNLSFLFLFLLLLFLFLLFDKPVLAHLTASLSVTFCICVDKLLMLYVL